MTFSNIPQAICLTAFSFSALHGMFKNGGFHLLPIFDVLIQSQTFTALWQTILVFIHASVQDFCERMKIDMEIIISFWILALWFLKNWFPSNAFVFLWYSVRNFYSNLCKSKKIIYSIWGISKSIKIMSSIFTLVFAVQKSAIRKKKCEYKSIANCLIKKKEIKRYYMCL